MTAPDRRSGAAVRTGQPRPSTASATAAAVREGARTPTEILAATLARVSVADRATHAFTVVRHEAARAEATALERRDELEVLPLAGVPVAIEHDPRYRDGADPAGAGHPVADRLRAAGALVAGLSAPSECGRVAGNDHVGARNPWNTDRVGGGAAAAVAAGLVPVAHAADGFGAVRIAAADCGVFGMKPGRYATSGGWRGEAEHGVLATTVADAALVLSVLADRPDLAETRTPRRLRIAVAVASPHRLVRVDRQWAAAARAAGEAAAAEGHTVEQVELPYGAAAFAALVGRLTADLPGAAATRRLPSGAHHRRNPRGFHPVRPAHIDRIEARLLEFFERYDVVITPTSAAAPPRARRSSGGTELLTVFGTARRSPFTGLWNLVGWPAASLPMGMHTRSATPVAAQLAGPPGSEATLLNLAAQLERRAPWQRVVVG